MTRRTSGRSFWLAWGAAVGVALLPVVLATLPPFLGGEARAMLMQAFAPFCHQMPTRSPYLMGVQLAVGHRVYGILLGLALGSVAYLSLIQWDRILDRRAPWVLAVAVLPMITDWTLGWLDLWATIPLSRMATGGLFGAVAGLYLTRAFVQTKPLSRQDAVAPTDSTN